VSLRTFATIQPYYEVAISFALQLASQPHSLAARQCEALPREDSGSMLVHAGETSLSHETSGHASKEDKASYEV
jgi:hypothetical protein